MYNPTDTNHGNGTFLYTSWDGGNDNCTVQNDDFFINYTLPPPTPTLLLSIDSGALWGSQEYRHRVSVPEANREIYDLWNTGSDDWEWGDAGYFSIYVDTDNNTWADYGTTYPFSVVENSDGTVSLSAPDTGLLYKFTKPTTASWISTPPPTPTFDIALTNDNLAITATLTNIVNPDPYYTVSIHNDTSTQIASHTFSTSDTSVVLTWNETTYGVKTYTVKINGTTSSTESITLTDPNTPTTPSYVFHLSNGSLSMTFTWDGTDATWLQPSGTGNLTAGGNTATWQTQDFASGYGTSPGQFRPGILGVANYGPYDIQQNETHDSTYHIVFTNNT